MDEIAIRNLIMNSFPTISPLTFPNVDFLKVVGGNRLVNPEISEWDYKTIMHTCGQGPLYIRALEKGKLLEDFERVDSSDSVTNSEDNASANNDEKDLFIANIIKELDELQRQSTKCEKFKIIKK